MTLLSKLPPGMRYYLGAEARLRRSVEDTAMSVFEGWSYEEVLTPTVDYYALFERGMGQSEAETSFRFTDRDGLMLSLRPDVTSSVARVAATLLADRKRPLRLCYAAPVFRRQQQSHAEWRRENTQLGCELIGGEGAAADLEVLLVAAEILTSIGLRKSFCITINDVGIFNGLVSELGLDYGSRDTLRRLIDTRDRAELKRFLDSNCPTAASRQLLSRLAELTGDRDVLVEARRNISNDASLDGIEKLARLWDVIESLGLVDSFEIDLADVSSLDYYTGLSFKVFVQGVGYRVGRGGRYDGLTANFGSSEPAVGFVLSLDSLVEVLGKQSDGNVNNGSENYSIAATELEDMFSEAVNKRASKRKIRIELKS
ncbi:MAG TPA: ATP phosphoribosyltransferase regulatory subunit [Pyrinomonadaceae bacterium]|nr:ATP phosphoribosyltransferase regulatory subunit [Pyrinomonadaceae bacterium]